MCLYVYIRRYVYIIYEGKQQATREIDSSHEIRLDGSARPTVTSEMSSPPRVPTSESAVFNHRGVVVALVIFYTMHMI